MEKNVQFNQLKRDYEKAVASGKDTTKELTALATAIARSVLNKCIDPQRKTACDRDIVSSNGYNPALLKLKHDITADTHILALTADNINKATRLLYNNDGDIESAVVDKQAEAAVNKFIKQSLSDGIDLVQTATAALLEQTVERGRGEAWLDKPYIVRRLSKRVYIQRSDSAAYTDTETTPMREVFRAVRRYIQNSRAVQIDPRNGYSYIEELTPDELDTVYYRLGKYIDLGNLDNNGNYTTATADVDRYEAILTKLNLTDRQAQILKLRLQGYGLKAVSTYLGVTQRAIAKTVEQIRKKALNIGLTPPKK